jgi:hypothetical protein
VIPLLNTSTGLNPIVKTVLGITDQSDQFLAVILEMFFEQWHQKRSQFAEVAIIIHPKEF